MVITWVGSDKSQLVSLWKWHIRLLLFNPASLQIWQVDKSIYKKNEFVIHFTFHCKSTLIF